MGADSTAVGKGGNHIFRLQPLVTLDNGELHPLPFDQDAVAFAADGAEVDEDILARVSGDEAEAL